MPHGADQESSCRGDGLKTLPISETATANRPGLWTLTDPFLDHCPNSIITPLPQVSRPQPHLFNRHLSFVFSSLVILSFSSHWFGLHYIHLINIAEQLPFLPTHCVILSFQSQTRLRRTDIPSGHDSTIPTTKYDYHQQEQQHTITPSTHYCHHDAPSAPDSLSPPRDELAIP